MAFGLGLGKSKSKSKGEEKVQEQTVGSTTQTTTGFTGQETTGLEQILGQTQQAGTVQRLDEQTIGQLQNLIDALMGQYGQSGVSENVQAGAGQTLDYARQLAGRAAGTQEFLDKRTADIVAAERARGTERVGQVGQQLATQAGSSLNTLTQLGIEQSNINLGTELANLEAGLGIQARQAETEAMNQAFQALGAGTQLGVDVEAAARAADQELVAQINSIANILKGATESFQTAGETSQVGTTQQQQYGFNIQDILAAFQQFSQRYGISIGKTSGSNIGGGITFD